MGIFSPKELTKMEQCIKDIQKSNLLDSNKSFLLQFLEDVKKNAYLNFFSSEDELIAFIMTLMQNEKLCAKDFKVLFQESKVLYMNYCQSAPNTFSNFLRLFETNGLYENGFIRQEVMNVYDNPENYFQIMDIILRNPLYKEKFSLLENLITELAIYTPNDIELKTMLIYFLKNNSLSGNMEEAVAEFLSLAKKRAGIYEDLDDAYLAKVERLIEQIRDFKKLAEREECKLDSLGERIGDNRRSVELLLSNVEETLANLEKHIEDKTIASSQILEDVTMKQRENIQRQFVELYNSLIAKSDLQAKKLAESAALSVQHQLENIISLKEANKDLLKMDVDSLSILKDVATEEVREGLKEIKTLISGLGSIEDLKRVSQLLKILPDTGLNHIDISLPRESTQYFSPPARQERKIPEVIPMLDQSKDFKKRFASVMELKKEMESKGIHFHGKADEVIYNIMLGRPVYLYGPSGSGKSYFVEQLAKLFSADLYKIGYITEEYEIKGGTTAMGGYTYPLWYDCWKYGGFAFADEFDSGVPEATIVLSNFLSLEKDISFHFPIVGETKKHPNFRFIAAGNTLGTGATNTYNARNKIDEAIQQRLEKIYFGFDEKLDASLIDDYPEWQEFISLYRDALLEYSKQRAIQVSGQITTRDIVKIKQDLTCGYRSDEDILEAHFVGIKNTDTIKGVSQTMLENGALSKNEKVKTLVNQFSKMRAKYE